MFAFGTLAFLLVTVLIGILAAAALLARRKHRRERAASSLDQQLRRGLAVTHAILFTGYWAVLLYQHLLPHPWGDPNILLLLLWLPLFVSHMAAQFWLEARDRFGTRDTAQERTTYREGYADGRRDALAESVVRLTDEGELLDDYPLPDRPKRKRHADDPLAG